MRANFYFKSSKEFNNFSLDEYFGNLLSDYVVFLVPFYLQLKMSTYMIKD